MSALLKALGILFKAEHWIGRYRVDFYVPAKKLVIEVDGEYWHTRAGQAAKDRARDRALRALGYTVLRVWARHVSMPKTRSALAALLG